MKRLLDWLLPDRNPDAPGLWCKIGLHHWAAPGYPCRECGMRDRLWR